MVDEQSTALTSEEAGAFVAQWAELHKVSVEELAAKLGVTQEQIPSLLRQTKGRLSMERWLQEKQPKKSPINKLWAPVLIALVIGAGLGAFAIGYVFPTPAPSASPLTPLPPPDIKASVTEPPAATDGQPKDSGPATRSQDNSVERHTSNDSPDSGATAAGKAVGDVMGKLTTNIGSAPPRDGGPGLVVRAGASGKASAQDNLPRIDIGSKIKSKLPDDLVISVGTQKALYYVRGKTLRSSWQAQKIEKQDIDPPLKECVRVVVGLELAGKASDSTQDGAPVATVRVHVGQASAQVTVPWSIKSKGELLGELTPLHSQLTADLDGKLISAIHKHGSDLFISLGGLTTASK